MSDPGAAVERVFLEERTSVLATLVRRVRDFEAAEDALQEALVRALAVWPERGVPDRPGAWLLTVATNAALDAARRRSAHATAVQDLSRRSRAPESAPAGDGGDDASGDASFGDDRLRLMFTCCHPALDPAARVALTLQTVGGLTAREIARALLLPETATAQRLVRAKRKIRDAGIPYEVPPPERRRERLDGVRSVLYLVFNEGHQATESPSLQRTDLAAEAVRLARLLVALVPDDPESAGLLALLLVTHARRAARIGEGGALVPLETQDRSLWDHAAIAEGTRILDEALLARRPGPFQVQAAISALHATAPSWERTDWPQIAALYAALLRHDDSPVVELNRAVAVSMVEGPQAGLALLARLGASPQMAAYQPFHAARADLLRRAGRADEAGAAYEQAIVLSRNAAERRFLDQRRRSCRAPRTPAGSGERRAATEPDPAP